MSTKTKASKEEKKKQEPKLAVNGDFAKVFKILAKAKKQPATK